LASSQHAAYSDACGTATKYFANACTRYCPVQTRTPVYFKLERKNTHEWQLLQRFLPAWCGLYGLLVPGVVLDGWLGCGGLTPQRLPVHRCDRSGIRRGAAECYSLVLPQIGIRAE
jgi:hypothetical protein